MKKLMALFIATLLALSCAAMAEAPGFHAEGMPIVDEPVTIRVLTMRWADMGDSFADNPFLVNLEKESNVKIDWQIVSSNDWGDQKPIMLAGGTEVLPDVVLGFQTFNESDIMSNVEYFVPLEDMIEKYMPNLMKAFEEMPALKAISTSADGHIYSLPSRMPKRPIACNVPVINMQWLKNLNLEVPNTIDELEAVLTAFKEQDANGNGDPNDEIPMLCDTYCNPMMLTQYLDFPYSAWEKVGVVDGKLLYLPTSEQFKEFLGYVTKLYQEGLIYEHCYTTDHDQIPALGQSGDIAGSFFDAGAFLTVGRDNDEAYMALTPWDDCLQVGTGINANTMCITDKCEHPEILVAWMDRFYSEEGGILAWMGVEGVSWQYNDAGEWEWILGNGYGDDVSTVRASAALQGAQTHPSVQPEIWMTGMSADVDPDEAYLNNERARMAAHGVVPLPAMTYTQAQSEEISVIKTDTDSYFDQYVAQVVTGELSLEDSWDSYVETMNAMGAPKMLEIYQEVYDAANK